MSDSESDLEFLSRMATFSSDDEDPAKAPPPPSSFTEIPMKNGHMLNVQTDAREGCGGHIWNSGVLMCTAFQNKAFFPEGYFQNKTVLELGAGTGVAGLAAACLGARVILTDLPYTIDIMRHNIEKNHLQDSAVASVLEWGQTDGLPKVDLVIAADVLYVEEVVIQRIS
eukprot:GCRY01003338.1.p1 GENE.GCRY01003338.1~~GCRY01003338.1.p1  ORF type:complete len:169 (+),score=33.63 GCRY01003338.1:147-653(+)